MRRLQQASQRRARGLTILEGPNLLAAAVAAGTDVEMVYTVDPAEVPPQLPVAEVSPAVLAAMADTQHPRGPLAVIRRPAWKAIAPTDTLVLYDVAEPGNAGTLIRGLRHPIR